MTEIHTLLANFKSQKAIFTEQLKDSFKQYAKELFQKVPDLTAVAWTQYAPYFNDGDACVFSVNEPVFTNIPLDRFEPYDLVNEDVGTEDDNEWLKSYWRSGGSPSDADSAMHAFSKLIQDSAVEEVLETMFGDGTLVFITREEIKTEDYEHD